MKYGLAVLLAILNASLYATESPRRPEGGQWAPVIGPWFWTQRDLEPEGDACFLNAAAA